MDHELDRELRNTKNHLQDYSHDLELEVKELTEQLCSTSPSQPSDLEDIKREDSPREKFSKSTCSRACY